VVKYAPCFGKAIAMPGRFETPGEPMKHRFVLTIAMVATLSPAAFAQQAQPPVTAVVAASAPGKGGVAGAVKVTATVVALDPATRTATL
jgi:hypothetical protein